MIEAIAGSLVVAAITGLTIIAYRHPRGYSKIGTATELCVSICLAVYMIWAFGYLQGFHDGQSSERFASPEFPIDPFPWPVVIVVAVQIYLRFLHRLPSILEMDPNDNENDNDR